MTGTQQVQQWLPDMDLNHDKQIQSLLCYRYTIGQTRACKVEFPSNESRTLQSGSARGWIRDAVAADVTRRNQAQPRRYFGGYTLRVFKQ